MLGDVSSHGYAAALIMALVRSAAGIHAVEAASPDGALRRLLDSVSGELAETEMFLTLFYGVVDPEGGRLRYANAGHPHAFRVSDEGAAERLGATSPPLGLTARDKIAAAETAWISGRDRLLLFSDGISDAANAAGERFGESRVLDLVRRYPGAGSEETVQRVLDAVSAFEPTGRDDRTVLVLRTRSE
jgi:sigma-B regulation protein RsbU (phosphoserine phosphatase)